MLDGEVVELLPGGVFLDFGSDVFPALLRAGARVAVYKLADPVIDIGTPEGLAQARAMAVSAA